MTWDNSKYIKLLLRRQEGVPDRYLIALRTTAEYYGWKEAFLEWTPRPLADGGARIMVLDPGRRGEMFCEAGRRHQISRSPRTNGWPAGTTNQFKCSASCTYRELAEVAHFTTGTWYWMTGPTGTRIKRERWEEYYEASLRRGERRHRSVA